MIGIKALGKLDQLGILTPLVRAGANQGRVNAWKLVRTTKGMKMKKFTTFLCAVGVAGSLAVTPAPARACYTNCGNNNVAVAASVVVLGVLLLILGTQLGSGGSGGLASTKGSADDDKGEPQFVKDF